MPNTPRQEKKTAPSHTMTLKDQEKRLYDVSHCCHCHRDESCVGKSHFTMESEGVNARRIAHHNRNAAYNCAGFGDTPCIVNGSIGEKVYDDKGNHVGWKRERS